MKTLPLTVLVHEGPQARAYLALMRRAGLRPARILLMVPGRRARGRSLARWLPAGLRLGLARSRQELAQLHWPRRIRRTRPDLVAAMAAGLGVLVDEAPALLEEIAGRFDYSAYAEQGDAMLVDGLADPLLRERLAAGGPGAVLYTGGGLVPRDLLAVEGLRFLHIHPGHLPDVRGADGLLWSLLVRGCPGASCFYMAPGIDVGGVVVARDFPALRFDIHDRPDDDTLYRALFSYYDPVLRAALLVRHVLPLAGEYALDALPATPQDTRQGVTYHFLHSRVRRLALERVFPPAR